MPKKHEYLYFLFRIGVGFLFLSHGMQKLFGLFGGKALSIGTLIGFSGLVEFVVGILIMLGFLTRLSAIIGAIEMFIAYILAHVSTSALPILNGGELTILYLACFLVIIAYGGQFWSLDHALFYRKS